MTADPDPLFDEPVDRATVTIEVGRTNAWLRGYGLGRLLVELGSPTLWCPLHRCLTIPIDRVGDLLAVLEHRDRRPTDVLAVDR
jgi:hypothetical protein